MFVSIRGRVLVNVEALNMTESVGNYVKHRRVPVISPTTYATYFVPAVSGESIAHGFQEVLAEEAKNNNELKDKVCYLCKRGIFLKSTNNSVIYKAFKDKLDTWKISSESDFEKAIISNCIVEDVGGFLNASGQQEKLTDDAKQKLASIGIMKKEGNKYSSTFGNIKRTSNFSTGYMIPTKEALESVVIEPQLHSRYALGTPFVEKGTQGQMIYYVELSSAPYVFSFDLDTKYIGKLTFSYEKVGELAVDNDEERKKRIDVTLDSLKLFLTEMMFGAKKTRFLPIIDWESVVIAISDDVWTVPSPLSANYITNTLNKLDKTENANTNKEESSSNGTELFVYINPIVFEDTTIYVEKKTEELLNSFYKALDEFKKKLEEREDANLIDWNEFKKKKLEELLENKIDELTASSDLKYASVIQEKYIKTKKELEAKGIAVYESFEECVSDAIKKAKEKEDEN